MAILYINTYRCIECHKEVDTIDDIPRNDESRLLLRACPVSGQCVWQLIEKRELYLPSNESYIEFSTFLFEYEPSDFLDAVGHNDVFSMENLRTMTATELNGKLRKMGVQPWPR